MATVREVAHLERRIAIIDVGSNSFRLIVVTYVPGQYFHVTDEVRETVRLVHGLGETGALSASAMDKGVEVLKLYRAFCDSLDISDIIAVATSAVREASNGRSFVDRVHREAHIRIRILSGEEEAYYGYLAAENSTMLRDGFVIDLGGGSMEITRVAGRRFRDTAMRALGAVRVTEDWLAEAPTPRTDVKRLRKHVRDELADVVCLRADTDLCLAAEGGSLRNLARLAQKRHHYPLDKLHGYELALDDVRWIVKELAPLSVRERRDLPGMKPDRADIALAAAVVIEECLELAGFDHLTVSAQGLREGLFYERYLPRPHLFDDVRRQGVWNVARLYHFQEQHAQHVADLALSLFDQLGDHATCRPREREILWAACMLHDIGMNVDYNDHHRHGCYLILNSGLPGFSHRELALVALLTRYHRKGMPAAGDMGELLEKGDEQRLREMAALLQLAEQLDRSRDGAVRSLRLRWSAHGPARLEARSPGDISVSLWAAQNHTDAFEAAFGRKLNVVAV